MKVHLESVNNDRLRKLKQITIAIGNGYRRFKILTVQRIGEHLRLSVDGVNSPEEAALLTGGEIVVSRRDRPDLGVDEYYIDDLIGCRVISSDGEELGLIREVWQQGHHDLWVIDGPLDEILVPAVREFILGVDINEHKVLIKHIEGLWTRN